MDIVRNGVATGLKRAQLRESKQFKKCRPYEECLKLEFAPVNPISFPVQGRTRLLNVMIYVPCRPPVRGRHDTAILFLVPIQTSLWRGAGTKRISRVQVAAKTLDRLSASLGRLALPSPKSSLGSQTIARRTSLARGEGRRCEGDVHLLHLSNNVKLKSTTNLVVY